MVSKLNKSQAVSTAGYGKPGYCRLCAWVHEPELNDRMRAGWNARQINDWMAKFGFSANRQTIYKHREHITSKADKVVAYAERSQLAAPTTVSNQQFLSAIRDLGMKNALADPDAVTVRDALKAVQIMENQKQSGDNVLILLAQVMTGNAPPTVIDGVAEEMNVG